ncbi:MAG: HD domain-containing protein [Spirochaetia bacterium]|nr:HD domain-containing protein [Spirochaetia bacterium]
MVCSFSALDDYFSVPRAPVVFSWFDGGMVELARSHGNLSYPGLPYADASDDSAEPRIRYVCSDGDWKPAYRPLGLIHDADRKLYRATGGVYEALREPKPSPAPAEPAQILFEAAVLASRYDFQPDTDGAQVPALADPAWQRDLLDLIVTGRRPERGLELLRESGFLGRYWPELASLAGVDHVKDYHPEGDVWRHTMETFSHRKEPGLILSLALLLHDSGKPDAVANEGRRFDRHSELGERTARSFLGRLGYPGTLVDEVAYLVRYHMLPSALPRIPPSALEGVLDHPGFPTLLELYRCDELSTFRGPDGYYEACAAYKAYLKNRKNRFRNSDGKKRPVARD